MVFEFSTKTIIILDIIVWLFIHIAVAYSFSKLPFEWFENDGFIYRARSWERNGRLWERVFSVKKWKHRLPDGAGIFKNGFKKKTLMQKNEVYFKNFVTESRRGEMTHWVLILFSLIFFLWNPFWVGLIMILYALTVNMPCIIAQRYNRPRFEKIINRLK